MRSQTVMVGALMLFIGLIIGSVGTAMVMSSQTSGQATAAQDENADTATAEPAGNAQDAPVQGSANPQQQRSPDEIMEQLIANTRHFKGDPDAPVTIIEFSDFRCPYCSKFAVEAGSQIDEVYVESGQVRVGYWHAAYQGEPAIRAAEASECAADQDAFWPYHDRLVEAVAVEGYRDFAVESLTQFAEEIDLDTETFSECLASGKYNQLVIQQTIASQSDYRVGGTPMFLVNGRMVSGAQPFEAFQQVIDMSLGS